MTYELVLVLLLLPALSWLVWHVRRLEKALNSLRKTSLTVAGPTATEARKKRGKRYLVFLLLQEKPERRVEVVGGWITDALKRGLGELEFSLCRPHLIYFSPRRGRGVLRVNKECVAKVITCLSLERRMGNSKVLFVPIRTTGTLKRARKYLFDRQVSS